MGGRSHRVRWASGWALAGGMALVACGTGGGASPPGDAPVIASSIPTTTTTAITLAETTTTMATVPDPPVPLPVTTTTMPFVPGPLEPGDRGRGVIELQEAMADAGFFRDVIDGVFGERTATAVIAVHKALELPRTASWAPDDWATLAAYAGPALPDRDDEPDRLEVDLTRQLLYRVAGDTVVDIIPVSTGNGAQYENAAGRLVPARTPRGDFSFYKHYEGWRISYLGGLYRPWYFSGGYAIHGSASVPAYPASHGCVRVPNWEADYLAGELWIGLPVHLWD